MNGRVGVESRPDLIWSAHDNLFTSGTLGRYSKILNSVIEKRLSHPTPDKEEYVRRVMLEFFIITLIKLASDRCSSS